MEIELKIKADAQSDTMAELLQVLSTHVSERPFEEPTKSLIANLAEKELPKAKETFEEIQMIESDPLPFTVKEDDQEPAQLVLEKKDSQEPEKKLTLQDIRALALPFIKQNGRDALANLLKNKFGVDKLDQAMDRAEELATALEI